MPRWKTHPCILRLIKKDHLSISSGSNRITHGIKSTCGDIQLYHQRDSVKPPWGEYLLILHAKKPTFSKKKRNTSEKWKTNIYQGRFLNIVWSFSMLWVPQQRQTNQERGPKNPKHNSSNHGGRVESNAPTTCWFRTASRFRVQASWESRERVVLQGVPWWKSGPHHLEMRSKCWKERRKRICLS